MTDPLKSFEQLVFSGGGIRCFWHGGFLSVAEGHGELSPKRISGVSGGALSGAAWISRREEKLRNVMGEAFETNDANFDAGKSNFTPHQEMYREVVEDTLDEAAIAAVADGPDFQVVLSVPPQSWSPRACAAFYGIAYQLDQAVRSTPHLVLPKMAGLDSLRVDARQAARDGTLVDLICAAATIPPVFDVPEWDGKRVLDGGMMGKAPPPDPDEGKTLFLLTRVYRNLPQTERRTYCQPTEEVAADKIDFTDRTKIERTWAQGEKDAKAWLAQQEIEA